MSDKISKAIEELKQQLERVEVNASVGDFYKYYMAEALPYAGPLTVMGAFTDENIPKLMEDEAVYLEVIKVTGILESVDNHSALMRRIQKRYDIKEKAKMRAFRASKKQPKATLA